VKNIYRTLAVFMSFSLSLPAQTQQSAPQADPVFKSGVNLVVVDVTVLDKAGKEISTLKKDDFVVMEDGKPQTLSVFEFQKLAPAGTENPEPAPPPTIKKDADKNGGRQQQITATPGKIQYQDRRLLVMLFDFSDMAVQEQIRTRDSALDFIKNKMSKADLVSVMTNTTQLNVVQDFTADKDQLIQTINKFQIGVGSDLATDGGDGTTGDDDGSAFQADETEFNIFNTDRKLSSLESAAKMLAALPEKKALLYFSSGISKQGVENQSQLRSTINTANRSNVSFYPIDARGLAALPPGGDATHANQRGNSMFTGAAQTQQRAKLEDTQDTVVSLAADTGGKAFLDDNDLAMGIVNAQNDVKSYYILGYNSTNDKEDGKFRRVTIKMANKELQASSKLNYKSGYFAAKTFAKFTSADKESQLQDALMLGDPVTDLPMAVETDFFRLSKTSYFVPVSVKIPGSELAFAKKGPKEQTDFDFIGQIRDMKGKLAGQVRDGITVKLTEENVAKLQQSSIQYDTGFSIAPGQYRLKLLARENQTGKMGTFETTFTIPDLSTQSAGMHLSSVIWGNQRQPMNAAVGTAGANKKDLAADPLIQDGQKLVPSISKVYRKNQNLYVYLEVYDPAADATDKKPSVSATLTFYKGKRKAFESTPVRLNDMAAGRSSTVPLQFQVPLDRLTAGKYVAQVNIIDEQAKKFAFPRTEMVLLK
jgi:VWFA-related protein